MDEHEQGERVRAWLRQNGATIVTGIALGIAAILAWNWYQAREVERAYAAGGAYHRLVVAAEAGDHAQARAHADALIQEFGRSPYAVLAALRLASMEVARGDNEAAMAALESARGRNPDPALDELLSLRKARLHVAAGQYDQALSLIDGVGEGYAAMKYELRGDALLAMGRTADARAAYVDALTWVDAGDPARQLLELKLIDLGGRVETPEA